MSHPNTNARQFHSNTCWAQVFNLLMKIKLFPQCWHWMYVFDIIFLVFCKKYKSILTLDMFVRKRSKTWLENILAQKEYISVLGCYLSNTDMKIKMLGSLIIPFLRFGEWMINSPTQFELTSDAFKKIISGSASRDLLLGVSHVVCNLFLYWLFRCFCLV